MHILFLTDNFPPEVNAPATRTYEHCREWVRAGHSVTIITCVPNFPAGRVFAGYRNKLVQSEEMDGIRVVRVWSYVTANEGLWKRSLDYVSYMLSAIAASPFVRRVDVVVATSPQFFTACAGYLVARMRRVPFVFELRDLWPESIRAVGAIQNARLLGALERLELFLYRRASAIVSVTHSFRENLMARGIEPAKIHVITNGVDLSRFVPAPKPKDLVARFGLDGKFVAGYVGTHGMAHGLDTLVRAATPLTPLRDGGRICILLIGDGAAKRELVNQVKAIGLDTVQFVDTVPKDEVARYWALLDVAIIHLRRTALFTTVIPSKLFEAMAMGVPILLGVEGEAVQVLKTAQAGIAFEPENAEALYQGLISLSQDPGLRAKLAGSGTEAARAYDRSALAMEMLNVLTDVALAKSG